MLPVCPRKQCAELNDPDSIVCHACGCRLVPERRSLERWMRVRGAIAYTADGVDADQVANAIVADLEQREGKVPWPTKDAA